MRAIVQERYGPPEVLALRKIDVPTPGEDEVLVRVHAAGVDPGVWHLMAGVPYLIRVTGVGLRAPKSRVRGRDFAGTVEAIGRGVTRLRAGDEVFGVCDGSFAEYGRAREGQVARKPTNLTMAQAAAVPISACAALHALRDRGEIRAGQSVLVIGAAGGVGSFAVQLAKALGAVHVAGVCSTASLDVVRSIGADEVIDYTREDITRSARRYDLVVDTAGRRPLRDLRRILAPLGRLVLVGGEGGGRMLGGFERMVVWAPILSLLTGQRLRGLISSESTADLDVLRELIEAGRLSPIIGRTYPLEDAPRAIRDLHEGHARGKAVVIL